MEFEQVALSELKTDEENPNKMKKEQLESLKSSIEEYGNLQPIVIDQHSNIIDGHHRYLAYKELKKETISAIRIQIDSDSDKRIIRQTMNKLRGTHDPKKDAEEFLKILKANEESKLFKISSISEQDFFKTIKNNAPPQEKDIIPELPKEPITKLGDIWELGEHKLICADSSKEETYQKLMGQEKAHLVITDPPYGVGFKYNNDYKDVKDDEYLSFCEKWWNIIKNITQTIFITTGNRYEFFWQNKKPFDRITWIAKNKQSPGKSCFVCKTEPIFIFGKIKRKFNLDYLHINLETSFIDNKRLNHLHPCPKPTKLFEEIINLQSERNEIVLDIFAGSGTTLIACEKTGRKCRTIELSPAFCDVCVNRWQHYTGLEAKRISNSG